MNLFFAIVLLILGFIFLIKGADLLVDGSSSLAKKFSIPEIVIGLTIVAFGTSMPELVVNIISSLNRQNDITLGNIIGSNLFNLLLILGISALIYPISVQKSTVWKEIPFSLFSTLILVFLVNDKLLFRASQNTLSFVDGLIFLGFFILFLIYIFNISKNTSVSETEVNSYSISKIIILIFAGFFGLFLGGKLVVNNAVIIATTLKISEKLIAVTIISGGTSLPELITSSIAAFKRRSDIAIGNVIGSNIFNILLILGVSSMIGEVNYNPSFNFDLYLLTGSTILLFLIMFIGKKYELGRWKGFLLLLIYIAYVVFLVLNG